MQRQQRGRPLLQNLLRQSLLRHAQTSTLNVIRVTLNS